MDQLTRPPARQGVFADLLRGLPMASRRLKAGEVLFHRGDPGEAAQLIMSGLVGLEISGRHREPLIAVLLREGDIAAVQRFLLPGSHHETTARALTDCHVQLVRAGDVEATGRAAAVRTAMTEAMVDERAELFHRLVEAAHHTASSRVAGALCRLVGSADAIEVSQDVVAAVAGVVRVTANSELRRLADRRLVRLERRRITVLDREALVRAAR